MTYHKNSWRAAALGAVILAAAACDRSTSPHGLTPVRFQIATTAASAGAAPGLLAATGPIEVSTVQLVVGRAALGDGAEFGCHDCQGNFTDDQSAPTLVTLPLGAATVAVVTEQVSPGRYGAAELSLMAPSAGTIAGMDGAPAGTTVRVVGRFNGVPFRLDLAIDGSFRGALIPPMDIATGAMSSTASVTIRLPVDSWFVSNGVALDPAKAGDRASIEANIRASFSATEAEASSPER